MSEEQGDDDKPYEPSQKKLDDARAKGEVPNSTDLTTAAVYAGFLLVALAAGSATAQDRLKVVTTFTVLADMAANVAKKISITFLPFMMDIFFALSRSRMKSSPLTGSTNCCLPAQHLVYK